jgi:hypothetical protein
VVGHKDRTAVIVRVTSMLKWNVGMIMYTVVNCTYTLHKNPPFTHF